MGRIWHNLKLIILFTKAMFQIAVEYRLGIITWAINGTIGPLFAMSIWLIVGQFGTLPLSSGEIITYYVLTIFVTRATQSWTIDDIGYEIVRGDFSVKLLKPYSYLVEDFGHDMGIRIMRFITLTPMFAILAVLLWRYVNVRIDVANTPLFILALGLGLGLRFVIENLLVSFIFWTEDMHSINMSHELLRDFFSGNFIPIFFAPLFLKNLMLVLPFRYYVSFPIEVIMGKLSPDQLLSGFLVGVATLVLLSATYKLIFPRALSKYAAFGH